MNDIAVLTEDEIKARILVLDRQIAEVEGPDWLLRLNSDRGEDRE